MRRRVRLGVSEPVLCAALPRRRAQGWAHCGRQSAHAPGAHRGGAEHGRRRANARGAPSAGSDCHATTGRAQARRWHQLPRRRGRGGVPAGAGGRVATTAAARRRGGQRAGSARECARARRSLAPRSGPGATLCNPHYALPRSLPERPPGHFPPAAGGPFCACSAPAGPRAARFCDHCNGQLIPYGVGSRAGAAATGRRRAGRSSPPALPGPWEAATIATAHGRPACGAPAGAAARVSARASARAALAAARARLRCAAEVRGARVRAVADAPCTPRARDLPAGLDALAGAQQLGAAPAVGRGVAWRRGAAARGGEQQRRRRQRRRQLPARAVARAAAALGGAARPRRGAAQPGQQLLLEQRAAGAGAPAAARQPLRRARARARVRAAGGQLHALQAGGRGRARARGRRGRRQQRRRRL